MNLKRTVIGGSFFPHNQQDYKAHKKSVGLRLEGTTLHRAKYDFILKNIAKIIPKTTLFE